MPFYNWSTSAASNATSDPTCPFPEGMAPSAVNDGVRAAMARLREYANDIAGSIVTTGTLTAYAVSSNQGFTTLAALNGQAIAFSPHTTCGAGATLNVDGLGAVPLMLAPGTPVTAGSLIQGTPYVAVYNSTAAGLFLQSFFGNPYNTPIGGMMPYLSTTPPNSSFVLPYGQAISRTTYATLFALCGTAFGTGDGSTTFNVPDLRGRLPVGLDNMGGTAAGRVTSGGSGIAGATIGAAGGGETYTVQRSDLPNVAPTFTGTQQTWSTNQGGVPYGTNNIQVNAGTQVFAPQSNGSSYGNLTTTITPAGVVQSLNGGVTQTAQNNMPPAVVVPWILRVI